MVWWKAIRFQDKWNLLSSRSNFVNLATISVVVAWSLAFNWEFKKLRRQLQRKRRIKIKLSKKNGLNPGVTYLDWKRSSGWLESWEGLLLVTGVSTTCAETITTVLLRTPITQMIFFNQGTKHSVNLSVSRLFHVVHVVQNRRTALSLAWDEWFSCEDKEWKIYC